MHIYKQIIFSIDFNNPELSLKIVAISILKHCLHKFMKNFIFYIIFILYIILYIIFIQVGDRYLICRYKLPVGNDFNIFCSSLHDSLWL